MDSPRITIFDTTLRDGEQSPGCSMNVQEKVRLARQLDKLGVDVIEAGFPIASDGDFGAVQAVAAAVPRPIIAALARAARHDIDRAAQALGDPVPAEFGGLITQIRQRVRGIENVTISTHCHNDLGLAVANSLAAVAAGARQVECTINGIGERAGNASLEEIVMAFRVRPDQYAY